jgi:hypothetical protein
MYGKRAKKLGTVTGNSHNLAPSSIHALRLSALQLLQSAQYETFLQPLSAAPQLFLHQRNL